SGGPRPRPLPPVAQIHACSTFRSGQSGFFQVDQVEGARVRGVLLAGRIRSLFRQRIELPGSQKVHRGSGAAPPNDELSGRIPLAMPKARHRDRRTLRLGLARPLWGSYEPANPFPRASAAAPPPPWADLGCPVGAKKGAPE